MSLSDEEFVPDQEDLVLEDEEFDEELIRKNLGLIDLEELKVREKIIG